MTTRGRFITLEGGEGAGKTTQCQRLATFLGQKGLDCIITREPGGTDAAEALRNVILHHPEYTLGETSELLLFLAARRHHTATKIKPALDDGYWVICDRYQDSTTAYQGYGDGLGYMLPERLYRQVMGAFQPDLTLILDLDVREGLRRARAVTGGTTDRFEDAHMTFHQRLHSGFHDIAARYAQRCQLIPANGTEEEVYERLSQAVEERFFA